MPRYPFLPLLLTCVVWSNPSQAIGTHRILDASGVIESPMARPSSPPSYSPSSSKKKKSSFGIRTPTKSPSPEPTRSPKISDKKTKSPSPEWTESEMDYPTSAPKKSNLLFPDLDSKGSSLGSTPEVSAKGRKADTLSPTAHLLFDEDDLPLENVETVHLEVHLEEQQSVTFSIPLKSFELTLWRDPKWSSSFDDKHIQYTVEQFLGPSLDTPDVEGKNVTLKLQSVTCDKDTTECAYRFQGSYYYDVALDRVVNSDAIWIQQLQVMMDQPLLQAAFDKNPFMAVSRVRVISVKFLDGRDSGLPSGGGGKSHENTYLLVVAGCVGVVLISMIGTVAIYMASRHQGKVPEELRKPPVPSNQSKSSRTSRSTNPTATIVVYHTDAPSVTSSITEQRVKDDLPDYASYAMSYTLDQSICETLDM